MRAELLARGLAPRTATIYTRTIAKAEDWCERRGASLDTIAAAELMEWVVVQHRSHSTMNHVRSALRHYFELIGRDDLPAIKLPRRPTYGCRALDADEAGQLALHAALRYDDPGLSVLVPLYTGFRAHETAKLRWQDIRPDWSEVYVVGKGGVAAWVPLHPWLASYLQRWPRRDYRWVFPSPQPGYDHVCPTTIWKWCRLVSEEAGLGLVSPHRLRHTSLATANDATKDLRAVMTFARHASTDTTLIYTRTTSTRLNAVVRSLDFHRPRPTSGAPPSEEDGGLRLAA